MRLKDRVSLVTGGSGGIGQAICRSLAEEGAVIALHYHAANEDATQDASCVAAGLRAAGHRVTVYTGDLTDAAKSVALVEQVLADQGRIDILVNVAGMTIGGKDTLDVSLEEWRQVMSLNLDSVFFMCRAVLPHMRARGSGQIVNFSSNVINTLPGGSSAYSTSKSGVVALTKVLSKEEAPHGIRVNVVSPGIIDAGMGHGALLRRPPEVRSQFLSTIPMKRAGEASEVAAAVVFLVSDEASYVTGQNLCVNGGDRTESYQ